MRPRRLAGMAGIGVDRVGSLADALADRSILRFENLDTDLRPHPRVVDATRRALTEDRNNSYLPFVGQTRLREAAAAHVSRLSGVPYSGARNVIISAGGLSGILNVLLTVVDTDDEVVLTDPTYVGLINRVRLAGGVPRLAPFTQARGEWRLDRDALRRAVTPKTRALLLMSPSMPSGGVLRRGDWEVAVELARERDLWLIYDAAMERILYDGRPYIHPASLPGAADRVITVGAASKELRMIGWRVGWIVAPERLLPDLALVSMGNVVVPVGIAQEAAAVALELGDSDVQAAVAEWGRRRDALLGELAGLPAVTPGGGWSMLLDGTPLGLTGAEMSRRLLEHAGVAATPMDGWGETNGGQHLRFVFANEPAERIRGVGARIKAALGV
ncbi:MAG TPA: pyridoxal phosphate-dependent aminotransferase [bacterium]|nr:pyridoxal phosphate-dependent aminotransferase [bacterium]